MLTTDAVAVVVVGALLVVAAWLLWRQCPARSPWGHRCDRKRGHEGNHWVNHACHGYSFDDVDS